MKCQFEILFIGRISLTSTVKCAKIMKQQNLKGVDFMAMEKITCLQEKDGTRRIVTERWEMLFQPLNGPETYTSMENDYFLPEFKVIYLKNGTETYLGDARVGEKMVDFFQEKSEMETEVKKRVMACKEILWQMEKLEEV